MVLRKRVIRELRAGKLKYSAFLLMVVLSLTMAIGMGDWTKIIEKTLAETNAECRLENGEFSVYVELSRKNIEDIEELGAELEYAPYKDLPVGDGSTLRAFKPRKSINLILPDTGRLPIYRGEIFLEQLYAGVHGLEIGSEVILGGEIFTVCGIGTFPDYCSVRRNMSDIQSDYDLFSVCAVTPESFEDLSGSRVHNYAYRFDGDDDELRDLLAEMDFDENKIDNRYMRMVVAKYENTKNDILSSADSLSDAISGLAAGGDELYRSLKAMTSVFPAASMAAEGAAQLGTGFYALRTGVEDFRDGLDELFEDELKIDWVNLSSFVKAEDNPRITDAEADTATAEAMGIIIGIILFALMAYIMAVFTNHRLERESGIIGVLLASGYSSGELAGLYLSAPLLVTAVGSVIGTITGFAAAVPLMEMSGELSYYSVPEPRMAYSMPLLIYGLIMPTAVMFIVNRLAARRFLRRSPLSLMRGREQSAATPKVDLPRLGYVNSFRIRRILGEGRVYITMFCGLWVAILVMVFGVAMYQTLTNYMVEGAAVPYEYMTIFSYPPDKAPKNCEEAYVKSLDCDFELTGGTLDVMLIGVKDKSDYFPLSLYGNKNEIYLTAAAAEKLGYSKGDKIVLSDELTGRAYSFKIRDIVSYNSSLTAFMSIEKLRDKLELDEDEFNAVFSNKKPDVPEGRIASQMSRSDLEKSSKVFFDIMMPMTFFMIVIGMIIFILVMYLLMSVMIERAAFSVALLKIFGYNSGELSKLYIGGSFYAVLLTTVIAVPTCKAVAIAIFPFCVTNVSANITAVYDWRGMAVTVAVVGISYMLVRMLLVQRLNKMPLAQALKHRE